MDFDLSPDQVTLQQSAREFLTERCRTQRVRAVHESGSGWDRELWAAIVELGWLGVAVPESEGGLGLGWVELAVVVEAAARHVMPVPFVPTVVALEIARLASAHDLVQRLLSGDTACVAWSADASSLRADGERLSGRSDPVPFGPTADVTVVLARTGTGEPSVFVLDLADDTRPRIEPGMDLSRPLGWLELEGVPARRLGGEDLAVQLTDLGAMASSVELLGTSSVAMELAVQYAKDRVQFGRPIGSFQAVKHRCADMLVDVEGIRSSAYWAAWCLSVDAPDRSIASSTAKVWAGDASKRVMASALQVHGGIGFTWEHDLHLFMKRAHLDQVTFGDSGWHRLRLAELLRAKVTAGESVL